MPDNGRAAVILGSVNVDLIIRIPRLPRPGEGIGGGCFSQRLGGKGANQAVALARLGVVSWLVGAVGDDAFGSAARQQLRAAGVGVPWLRTVNHHTGVAQILIDADGENMLVVASGANHLVDGEMVVTALGQLASPGLVVLANMGVPDEAILAAAEATAAAGCLFILNPAPLRRLEPDLVRRCEMIVLSEVEALALAQEGRKDPLSAARMLLGQGAGAVIVTRGAAGVDILRPSRPPTHQPAFVVSALDTTGAGDAFIAALVWAIMDGRDIEMAVMAGAAAGALATRAIGAQASLPDRDELERFLLKHS